MAATDQLKESYHRVFDGRVGFGRKPAILVVDFVNAYVSPQSPFYAPDVVEAIRQSTTLLAVARKCMILIIYTRVVVRSDDRDGSMYARKIPLMRSVFVQGNPLADIVPDLAPTPEDIVINKQYASCFFGTTLATILTTHGVDTIIVIGCSTSGCVRATAVDGNQHGFHVIVPRECVGDRRREPHEANLFDIDSKYGDVLSRQQVIDYLENCRIERNDKVPGHASSEARNHPVDRASESSNMCDFREGPHGTRQK